jgi:hypothetical protein
MSRTTTKLAVVFAATALTFSFAACGSPSTGTTGEPAPSMSDVQASAAPAAEEAAKPSTYKLGETAEYEGLTIGISAPTPFTPSEYAVTGSQPSNVQFTVTLTNTGTEGYDPILTNISAASASQEAEQVFDSANGLNGAPQTTILPGASTSYVVGFNVADPAQIVLDVTGGFQFETATFTS